MKTLLTSLFIAASLTVTSFSATHAENAPARKPAQVASYQSGMYTNAEGKLNIALDKKTGGVVDVRILNQAGKAIYDHQIGKDQTTARLRLDLSDLPDGVYQLVISNGRDVTTKAIMITTKPMAMSARLVALN